MRALLLASAGPTPRSALALLLVLMLVGCGQATTAAVVRTDLVDLPRSYRYAPADIVVAAGTTVTWTNNDDFTHSVRLAGDDAVLMMKPGERITHAFDAPGLYQYDCSLHPKDMKGSVLVESAAP